MNNAAAFNAATWILTHGVHPSWSESSIQRLLELLRGEESDALVLLETLSSLLNSLPDDEPPSYEDTMRSAPPLEIAANALEVANQAMATVYSKKSSGMLPIHSYASFGMKAVPAPAPKPVVNVATPLRGATPITFTQEHSRQLIGPTTCPSELHKGLCYATRCTATHKTCQKGNLCEWPGCTGHKNEPGYKKLCGAGIQCKNRRCNMRHLERMYDPRNDVSCKYGDDCPRPDCPFGH